VSPVGMAVSQTIDTSLLVAAAPVTFLHINGKIQEMLTLKTRYVSGSKTLMIVTSGRDSRMQLHCLSSRWTAHRGAPPSADSLIVASGSLHPAWRHQPAVTDTVELCFINVERQPCEAISIENIVDCEAASASTDEEKPRQFVRRVVLRIMVGGGR
jgi:hypothetical protein